MKPKPIKPIKAWACLVDGKIHPSQIYYSKAGALGWFFPSAKVIQVIIKPVRK